MGQRGPRLTAARKQAAQDYKGEELDSFPLIPRTSSSLPGESAVVPLQLDNEKRTSDPPGAREVRPRAVAHAASPVPRPEGVQ